MKRPFVILGFSYLFAEIFAIFLNSEFLKFSLILGAVFVFILFGFKKNWVAIFSLCTFLFSLLIYFLSFNFLSSPINNLSDKSLEISGNVCDFPIKLGENFIYTIKLDSVKILEESNYSFDSIPGFNIKVLSKNDLEADPCDRITLEVKTFKNENLTGFSNNNRNLSKGIHLSAFASGFNDPCVQKAQNLSLNFYFLKLRNELSKSIKTLLPKKHASIANSFLLGQKDNIDKSVKSSFQDAGIGHLLVVSGTHMSVISQFAVMFFSFLKFKKRKAYLASSCFVLIFMALTGFTPSVIRSGIMCIIYMFGVFLHKKSDALNSLGLSVFILALSNPFIGGDLGFLLSVFATFGIILFSKKLYLFIINILSKLNFLNQKCIKFTFKYKGNKIEVVECDEKFQEPPKTKLFCAKIKNIFNLKKILDNAARVLAVSISSVLLNLPIMIFVFKKISFSFLITNILVSFTVVVVMISTLLAAIFSILSVAFVCKTFALISGIFINYILSCVNFSKLFNFLNFEFKDLYATITLFLIGLSLFFILKFKQKNKPVKAPYTLTIFALLCLFFYQNNLSIKSVKLDITNTGNGSILTFCKNNKTALLLCSGNKFYSSNFTNNEIKNLDLVMLSEVSPKAFKFLDKITENDGTVLLPKSQEQAERKNTKYFSKSVDVELWGNIKIESTKKNKKFWTKITINELSIALCPKRADLCKAPAEFLDCNFLLVNDIPKHLNKTSAEYILLSCDCHNYNSNIEKIYKNGKNLMCATDDVDINIEFSEDNKIIF